MGSAVERVLLDGECLLKVPSVRVPLQRVSTIASLGCCGGNHELEIL